MRCSQTRPLFCSYHRVSTLRISSPAASAGSRGFFARRKGPQPMFHCKARTLRVVLDKSLVHLERPILRVQIGCQSPHFTWLRRGGGKEKVAAQNPGAQQGFCTRLALLLPFRGQEVLPVWSRAAEFGIGPSTGAD